jgi:hypothetical protein
MGSLFNRLYTIGQKHISIFFLILFPSYFPSLEMKKN